MYFSPIENFQKMKWAQKKEDNISKNRQELKERKKLTEKLGNYKGGSKCE